jgi:hypothetical protein
MVAPPKQPSPPVWAGCSYSATKRATDGGRSSGRPLLSLDRAYLYRCSYPHLLTSTTFQQPICMPPHWDVHCQNVSWSNGRSAPYSGADGGADDSMFPQLILRSVGLWKNQFCALGNRGSVRMSKASRSAEAKKAAIAKKKPRSRTAGAKSCPWRRGVAFTDVVLLMAERYDSTRPNVLMSPIHKYWSHSESQQAGLVALCAGPCFDFRVR